MQNEPGACSGSKTPRVYRAYSLQATVNELKIIIFELNYLTVLVHTKTIIRRGRVSGEVHIPTSHRH